MRRLKEYHTPLLGKINEKLKKIVKRIYRFF